MAIRQTKTSGIDTLMQEMEAQAAEQQEAVATTEHIETLMRLNDTLRESIAELKDAKFRVDDAREVCEIFTNAYGESATACMPSCCVLKTPASKPISTRKR